MDERGLDELEPVSDVARSEPLEPDPIVELERELCRLPDITAARIVTESGGRPVEVHVVALPGKPAKQVVRDVQSVAMASFGLELDRRIISVVQLGGGESISGSRAFRPVIRAIQAEASGLRAVVRVTLEHDAETRVGFAEGSLASTLRHRLVAMATLDALRQLEPGAETIEIDAAEVVRVGSHDVAVVATVFVTPPNEESVSGSALVRRHDESGAVARALLDATNRRLPRIS